MNKLVYMQLLSCQSFSKTVWSIYWWTAICSFAQYVEDWRCASWSTAILSVSDRLIANWLIEIFQSFCLKVECLSANDPPKTRNCTNQRNHNQKDFSFSRRWPWAYFLTGPNAAASTAPILIQHCL